MNSNEFLCLKKANRLRVKLQKAKDERFGLSIELKLRLANPDFPLLEVDRMKSEIEALDVRIKDLKQGILALDRVGGWDK